MTATSFTVKAPEPTVLRPLDTAVLCPDLGTFETPGVWVYRYVDPSTGWRLSIATCAEPHSGQLSIGGFRIAPEDRTSSPSFDSDREAIGLAIGMEEKVFWSRLIGIGGPLALRDAHRVVGGKCVLHPTPDARIGQRRDRDMLEFAIACFQDAEERGGFFITTGQDLGHGIMADARTSSLEYLNARFNGFVVADTSKPTGEGNFYLLAGMLRGMDIPVERATVGLIGCGNVGSHVLKRLHERGTALLALDPSAQRREDIAAMGIPAFAPHERGELLRRPLDAIVVNASGGSLEPDAVAALALNDRLRVVCGSENLVMADHAAGSEALRFARKAYAPTALGGMMGHLTAVEEYLARMDGVPFEMATMFDAAKRLELPAYAATRHLRDQDYAIGFESALKAVCRVA